MSYSRFFGFTCLAAIVLLGISCTYTEKIRDGKTAFERKRYFQAVEMLEGEYQVARTNIDRMNIAYLLGESNLKFGNYLDAANWFKLAYEGGYGATALSAYASCLKQQEKYEEAAANYAKLGDEIGDRVKYRSEIANCMQSAEWKNDARYSPYVIENLELNSVASDYAAVPVSGHEIAFTSDRDLSTGDFKYAWSGNDFSDIFLADLTQNSIKQYDAAKINIDENEGTIAVSKDGTKMVFCRCFSREDYDAHCKLMVSEKVEQSWSEPVILSFVKDGVNYRHPAFSDAGDMLIFAANLEEATNDYDLYVSRLVENTWQQPQSLGPRINTQSREGFPFITGDTLYYSSDFAGMGGLDIYKSFLQPNGQWSVPVNLKAPINSGADDFAFVINPYFEPSDSILEQGYFSSNRGGGRGSDDIYQFERRKFFPIKPVPKKEYNYEIVLDLRVFQRQYEDANDPNSKVIMRIPLSNAKITVTEEGLNFKETSSNQFGILSLNLNPEKEYTFFVSHDGFFNNELIFNTKNLLIDSTKRIQKFEERILLDKIFYDREIVLENIYYDLDESFIRDDAKPTLDSLANLLKINPQIKIQLSSHTDCRATEQYNEILSQARAQSAVDYLITKGIATDRMIAKGYGESLLAVDCICEECTEEQHQANRRTTFKVIE